MARRNAYDSYQSYCIGISDWSLTYSLGLSTASTSDPAYNEYESLIISGTFLVPKRLSEFPIDMTFLADREMSQSLAEARLHYTPKSIGQLTVRGQRREFLGSVPNDSMPLLVSGLETKRLKFIVLDGASLRYGSASITFMHWNREFDSNDYE